MAKTVAERFWEKVDATGVCWEWTASRNQRWSYGQFRLNERTCRAHRVAYELLVGPIPEGLDLDHLCRNRACVNPDRLEPVTRAENLRRSPITTHNRTHCPHGHPYSPENTHRDRHGMRFCKACWKRHRKAKR